VGNHDAVFVNNRVEGATNGFMFEISRGATVAGNVFVRCQRGVYVLNSADVKVYNNTFIDAPASFERNQRSATGDRFGWHPSTGPDVNQREGHVFANNLVTATDAYRGPLARFEQPAAQCATLTRPMASLPGGNVYVRAGSPAAIAAAPALITWSPSAAEGCVAKAASLDEFRKLAPSAETGGRLLDASSRSVFKGPEAGRYELRQPLPGAQGAAVPAEVRKLLGWSEEGARTAGAYPFRK
jgi:parallel beta-helix repeat protein